MWKMEQARDSLKFPFPRCSFSFVHPSLLKVEIAQQYSLFHIGWWSRPVLTTDPRCARSGLPTSFKRLWQQEGSSKRNSKMQSMYKHYQKLPKLTFPNYEFGKGLYAFYSMKLSYMCPIPASEEFITEFGELPFLSQNSVHTLSPFSMNHIFFHWIYWHFCPWFWCSYYFALNLVNFLAPTWSLKKTYYWSP